MKILGIDPGLNFTGWGVIDVNKSSVKLINCGAIKSSTKQTSSQRLYKIYSELKAVIDEFSPDVVSVEETFVNNNPRSALRLGYARGVLLMVPSIYNLEVFEYSATKIKKTVAGNGHASKEQMKAMIGIIMPETRDIHGDAIDALSIALCHSYHKIL